MPGARTHFALVQRIVEVGPIHVAGLRFNDPNVSALQSAHQIVHQSVPCRIEVATADVVIPGNEGERLGDPGMIEAVEPAHEVSSNELARLAAGSNDLDLCLLVAGPSVC